jgi:hypothetical protein
MARRWRPRRRAPTPPRRIRGRPSLDGHRRGGVVHVTGGFDDDAERGIVAVLARTVPGVAAVDIAATHPDWSVVGVHAIRASPLAVSPCLLSLADRERSRSVRPGDPQFCGGTSCGPLPHVAFGVVVRA